MAVSFMKQFGGALVENGWPILPIMPGTKKPGRYRGGSWSDYPDWTRHAARATTENELAIWRDWPDAGVGIMCGRVIALDIDLTQPELAGAVEELARERLGDTPLCRIGRPPKRLLVYRAADPFRGIRRAPLEVLGEGQQFVAHAIHPDTGRPYDWPDGPPADRDVEDLPVIDRASAEAFLEEALALLPERVKPARLCIGHSSLNAASTSSEGTREAITAALAYIPNADLAYDDWIRIGLALKGALGEDGADLFAAWSAQSGKDDPEFTARTWTGLKPERIGAGTIYRLALDAGWTPDPALVLDGAAPQCEAHPADAMLAKMQAALPDEGAIEIRATPDVPPPPSLDRLDGALKQMVDHILATAIRPQPWLAVGASIAALGTLMGRKVRTESNLRSNLYVLGIAESGGGKDHARKVIKEAFFQVGLAEHLGGERLASGAGLIAALARQPASLFQIDEFGKVMASIVDKRRAPKHLSEIWDLLTELATSGGTTFFGAEYADQKEKPRQDIIEPCCCLHGVSAPGPFWEALKSGSLHDGSLARFLVFRSADDIPDRNRQPASLAAFPAELIEAIRAVANVGAGHTVGNLAAIGASVVRPEPLTVPADPKAVAVLDELDAAMTVRQRAAVGSDESAVLARVWESTAKVALIKAVSADPVAPVIRGIDAQWAREVVEHCVGTLLIHAERHLADNESEANHKKVLRLIEAAGAEGLSRSKLYQKTHAIGEKRDAVLTALVHAGQIDVIEVPTRTKPRTVYRRIL